VSRDADAPSLPRPLPRPLPCLFRAGAGRFPSAGRQPLVALHIAMEPSVLTRLRASPYSVVAPAWGSHWHGQVRGGPFFSAALSRRGMQSVSLSSSFYYFRHTFAYTCELSPRVEHFHRPIPVNH